MSKLTFLVSAPDFRLLVRDAADNNHETTLVVPELVQRSVPYARLLVDEGGRFTEHAVAFVRETAFDPAGVIARALRAARPTRVTFVMVGDDERMTLPNQPDLQWSQVAAAGLAIAQGLDSPGVPRSSVHQLLSQTVSFTARAFTGTVQLVKMGQFYQVEVVDDANEAPESPQGFYHK